MRRRGPAFAWAHERERADPDDPLQVLVAPVTEAGTVSGHPPAHVRLRFVTTVLDRMGFPAQAAETWTRWNEAHGEPETLYFPERGGGYVGIEADSVLQATDAAARAVVRQPLRALRGSTLADFPGLAFGPPEQQDAESRAADLRLGKARPGDPRAIVAAAVIAAEDVPAPTLSALVRKSILGIGTGERTRSASGRPRLTGQPAWKEELVEALILSEVVVTPAPAARWRPM